VHQSAERTVQRLNRPTHLLTEIAIKDDAGNDLQVGEIGEICVRGPQVMRGYWNRADETAKVMLPGGWLRTGDVGRIDARGFVYIEDRKKDMILVSGFNVYPNEVEAAVVTLPGSSRPLPSRSPTSAPVKSSRYSWCARTRRSPKRTSSTTAANRSRDIKVPKHVYFRTELPKTNVGRS